MNAAGIAEPKAVIQGIRGAQESYKAEMLVYLNVSGTINDWYPSATLGDHKTAWSNPSHADFANWRMLNVSTDGAVRFGYATKAGVGNAFTVTPNGGFSWAGIPGNPLANANYLPNGPWYVVQAAGDRDGDGTLALLLTASTMAEIYWENDAE
jgi:type IV pilus assembly protein PilA